MMYGGVLKKLNRIIEMIFLGVIFFGLIAPISVLCRLMGRDPLNLRLHGEQKSYWIERPHLNWASKDFYTQFVKKRIP